MWPATQGALYVAPQADSSRTHDVTVTNLFSIASWKDGINIRSSARVILQDIFIANTGDDALAVWAGAGTADVYFKGDFIVASNPAIRQGGPYGVCFAAYGGVKVFFDSFTCEDRSCDSLDEDSDPHACIDINGGAAVVLWAQNSFERVYPDGNSFDFGNSTGKFV